MEIQSVANHDQMKVAMVSFAETYIAVITFIVGTNKPGVLRTRSIFCHVFFVGQSVAEQKNTLILPITLVTIMDNSCK